MALPTTHSQRYRPTTTTIATARDYQLDLLFALVDHRADALDAGNITTQEDEQGAAAQAELDALVDREHVETAFGGQAMRITLHSGPGVHEYLLVLRGESLAPLHARYIVVVDGRSHESAVVRDSSLWQLVELASGRH